jgi:hypothetical protein
MPTALCPQGLQPIARSRSRTNGQPSVLQGVSRLSSAAIARRLFNEGQVLLERLAKPVARANLDKTTDAQRSYLPLHRTSNIEAVRDVILADPKRYPS